jgi:hypothetical protein
MWGLLLFGFFPLSFVIPSISSQMLRHFSLFLCNNLFLSNYNVILGNKLAIFWQVTTLCTWTQRVSISPLPRHFPQPYGLEVFHTSTAAQHTVKVCCSLARRGWPLMANVEAESCAAFGLGASEAGHRIRIVGRSSRKAVIRGDRELREQGRRGALDARRSRGGRAGYWCRR